MYFWGKDAVGHILLHAWTVLYVQLVCIKWLLCISCFPACGSISPLVLCSVPSYVSEGKKILIDVSFKCLIGRFPERRTHWDADSKPEITRVIQSKFCSLSVERQKLPWGICKTSMCAAVQTLSYEGTPSAVTGGEIQVDHPSMQRWSDPCESEERGTSWKIWCASALFHIM